METNLGQVVLVRDINPSFIDSNYGSSSPQGSYPENFTEFDDKLYFTANDGQSGDELFVSDGTLEGTQLVTDLVLGSDDYGYPFSSRPDNLIEFNDRLYFTANDGQSGNELWSTDGTSGGTSLVADINPGNYASLYSDFPKSSYADGFTEFNGKLYFIADDGVNGREPYVTDGTLKGTQLLADIRPGSNNYGNLSSYAYGFTEVNDRLYFVANNDEAGRELYVTDGTTDGTQLLADIRPNIPSDYSGYGSYPNNLIGFKDRLYFTANNGVNGNELFVSDGTTEGTNLLVDIQQGDSSSSFEAGSYADNFIELNDRLYFTANNGVNGNELFVSDGTTEGTNLLVDLRPETNNYGSSYSSYPDNLIEFKDKLYFTANDGVNGNELFVSDGTAEGTNLLVDIRIGNGGSYGYSSPLSSYINNFTEFDGKLYFTANSGEIGKELWVTDGTSTGTQLVEDLRPGTNNYGSASYPSNLTVVGDELFFSANNGETGNELFKLTAGGLTEETPILISGTDDDSLLGGDDAEQIDGLSGQDTINGGSANDTLIGGSGDDLFVIALGKGSDTIIDFNLESDRLGLADGLQFDNLSFSGNDILSDGEVLASLDSIDTEQLTPDNFSSI